MFYVLHAIHAFSIVYNYKQSIIIQLIFLVFVFRKRKLFSSPVLSCHKYEATGVLYMSYLSIGQ